MFSPTPAYIIEEVGNKTHLSIRAKGNWLGAGFLGFWMLGWAAGEFFALRMLTQVLASVLIYDPMQSASSAESSLGGGLFAVVFLLFWLTGWTLGGYVAGRRFLQMIGSSEDVTISADDIQITRKTLGMGKTETYAGREVVNFRAEASRGAGFLERRAGLLHQIAFEHEFDTVRFGSALNPEQAKEVQAKVNERHPNYAPEASVA